ncbi:MAG: ribosome biogenesis GTPase Der [Bacteroidales bacterium]|nr:ribosome biogenesis GTPase Der [Bacteroidales bacterium]
MGNILAIVGRPNVGKSTFFNRLTGRRHAIVDPTSGVTRDRHYGKADWNGVEFSVIDTGGFIIGSEDVFEREIHRQVKLAIDEADVILFMLDVRAGLTSMDEDIANTLRGTHKKVFLVANKADNARIANESGEFFALGFEDIYAVSSINGSGTGDLLDEVVKEFSKKDEPEDPDIPKFAVVGRPNVGKSSLINALLGDMRNIVTAIPGTTRDTINSRYKGYGFDFLLVDTAGIRRKKKIHENIEFYSVLRSIRAIEESDVCLIMVDATLGFESQDMNIFHLIQKNRKGVVMLVNKWDLVEKKTNTHKEFLRIITDQIAPFKDVPVIFTSVIEKQRIYKTLETAHEVFQNRKQKISTAKLNNILLPILNQNPPPLYKGKQISFKYITQLRTAYPSFVFFCNLPQYIKDPYKRYVENQIREHFNFKGVPVEIYFRKK